MVISEEVEAGIERYLAEVDRHLAGRGPRERRELVVDLDAHIHEALARRGHEPTLADLEAVLAEMAAPESYGAAPVEPMRPAAPAPPRESRAFLGYVALAFLVGGIAEYVVVAIIGDALHAGNNVYGSAAMLAAVLELLALVLGILSWRETAGKVAAIGVVLMLGAFLFILLSKWGPSSSGGPREAVRAPEVDHASMSPVSPPGVAVKRTSGR
jgi:hypothetical protein